MGHIILFLNVMFSMVILSITKPKDYLVETVDDNGDNSTSNLKKYMGKYEKIIFGYLRPNGLRCAL